MSRPFCNNLKKNDRVLDTVSGRQGKVSRDPRSEKQRLTPVTLDGTQKPVECMERPMRNNSKRGDSVYEPFCGSGTTIIAGERCGRRVFAMDISPWCAAVSIERWLDATGIKPVLCAA